jgi:hypothetical protein
MLNDIIENQAIKVRDNNNSNKVNPNHFLHKLFIRDYNEKEHPKIIGIFDLTEKNGQYTEFTLRPGLNMIETAPIKESLKDLQERLQALRGYL